MNPVQNSNQKTDVPLAHYAERFVEADPADIVQRTGVSFDPQSGRFSLTLLDRALSVAWPSFALLAPDGSPFTDKDARASPYAQILLLRYLLTAQNVPGTGKFCTYRELPWGDVYDANFQNRCVKRLAGTFGFRLSAFCAAMERLGGTPVDMGDAGYEVAFLGGCRMRACLWAGDEEFPPTAQILLSDNFSFAFTAEDTAVCGDILIGTLAAATQGGRP